MNLKTIAELAGVSTATVSNVLNGNFNKVSEETRKKVEAIIHETDYKPSLMARSLAKKESRMIGLVLPYISPDQDLMSSLYYAYIAAALERVVRNEDYYLMLRCVRDVKEIIPLLTAWNVDGAFFLGIYEEEIERIREEFDAPSVFIDTYSEKGGIVNVGIDDYRGGFLAARYLIGKGHRRFALARPPLLGPGVISERSRGFLDACRESGVDFSDEDVFLTDTYYSSGIALAQDVILSGRGYTAVAAMSDVVAIGAMEGLRQCGVRVPEDFSVIGFDNVPESRLVTPKLTTIEQDFRAKAEKAGEFIFRMIRGERELTADERLPIRIVERESVNYI